MIVVKIGGGKGILIEPVIKDIVENNLQAVIVHGCSYETDKLSKRLGFEPKFVETASGFTTRVTDEKQIESFTLAAMKVNKKIVKSFFLLGKKAAGLTGLDGNLALAKRRDYLRIVENGKKKVLRNDYTGSLEKINPKILQTLITNKIFPIIAPLTVDKNGDFLNIDGDLLAANIALEMNASNLVILSNIEGVYIDTNDSDSKIGKIPFNEIGSNMKKYAKGKMRKKLLAAKLVSEKNIKTAIATSNTKNPVSSALNGNGTVVE